MLVNIDELDYLVKRLESFDDRQLAAFQGMATAHGLEKPKDLINLTFSCENVTVVQNFSDLEKIGRQHYLIVAHMGKNNMEYATTIYSLWFDFSVNVKKSDN